MFFLQDFHNLAVDLFRINLYNKKDYNYDEDKILEVMLESIKKDILEEQSC